MIIRLGTISFLLFAGSNSLRLKKPHTANDVESPKVAGKKEEIIPGAHMDPEPPQHPSFKTGKYTRQFKSTDDKCILDVYSDHPEPIDAVPVDPNNISVCLADRDTTELVPEVDDRGTAVVTYKAPVTRGNHMDVTLECIDKSRKLIGRMETFSFKHVATDAEASTSWFVPQFLVDLFAGDKDHPYFQVIVDNSKVPAVEREWMTPLHKAAAAKYCKQMRDTRDRVFGNDTPLPPLPQ